MAGFFSGDGQAAKILAFGEDICTKKKLGCGALREAVLSGTGGKDIALNFSFDLPASSPSRCAGRTGVALHGSGAEPDLVKPGKNRPRPVLLMPDATELPGGQENGAGFFLAQISSPKARSFCGAQPDPSAPISADCAPDQFR
ncbi:hypothetical protein [Candidatus Halocynthiibacter alkanivorans]|uniref:hypothetical protein n=1 Tax=Candidatus Halocynthiibacter alkanivorans TaxID=2267619 RepID=UPI000DF498E3|nr:hypothetical protein [Candidatus Halocynthiibacter alkanivorans]